MSSIDDEITRAHATGHVSTGWDLRGFETDTTHALGRAGFVDVRITRHEDPRALLRVTATLDAPDASTAGARTVGVWCDALAYTSERSSEAHELTIDGDVARLRFVTSARGGALIVTGELLVTLR